MMDMEKKGPCLHITELPTRSAPDSCISGSTDSSLITLAFFFLGGGDVVPPAPPRRSFFFRSVTVSNNFSAFLWDNTP